MKKGEKEMGEIAAVSHVGISYGRQQYRLYSHGEWQMLMFGWWPDSNGRPSHRWRPILTDKVPRAVQEVAENMT